MDRLVVCDIDDTLVRKEPHVDDRIVEVVKRLRQKGIGFTFATGRLPRKVEVYAQDVSLDLPMIANNGSMIWKNGEKLFSKDVNAAILKPILAPYLHGVPSILFCFEERECPLVRTEWTAAREHKYVGYNQILGDSEEVWNQWVPKIFVVDESRCGVIGEIASKMSHDSEDYAFFQYGEYSMEIVASGLSKATGLMKLSEILGLPLKSMISIGDSENDVPAFQAAGVSVAVGNAVEELKSLATYVTEGERHEGVLEALLKIEEGLL
ncbi:MAG: Cof-type HAD-IIB family hydrolase [Sphaerochaetaceae bacterium]|nr:Cof-type HAD-IIB family hydrolase [Sphaerochaetaceae bacterium]